MRTLLSLLAALALLIPTLAHADDVDHGPFNALLQKAVKGDRVDYSVFKGDATFEGYLKTLQATDPKTLPSRAARLAFWINAYNAFTIQAVTEHLPGLKSVQDPYPEFGFFKRKVQTVSGEPLSLNDIENTIVRPRFKDPRIHAALNCASVSCPPLAPFAYTAKDLEKQLTGQMRRFARDGARNPISAGGPVKLSQIFNWYKDDFAAAGGVAAYLAKYLDEGSAKAVAQAEAAGQLQYVEYDWRLNAR